MASLRIPVITSRPAQKNLAEITAKHTDIMSGMQAQAQKNALYKQQQAMESKEKDALNKTHESEMAKTQNEARAMEMKDKEIEIKRMALSQP